MTPADVIVLLRQFRSPLYRTPGFRSVDLNPPVYNSPIRTFYVDGTSGNDSNSGTLGSPFLTLSKISATATAGDLFYLKGTFSGQWLAPSTSGTSTDRITIANWPGFTPVLVGGLFDGGVILDNVAYWVIDGIEVFQVGAPMRMSTTSSHDNWAKNCYVHGDSVAGSGGIRISTGSYNNRIEANRVEEIGNAPNSDGNAGDGITLINGAHDNIIIENYVGRCGHSGISATFQTGNDRTYNNSYVGNIINNPYAGGLIINGLDDDTLVEGNFIYGTGHETVYTGGIGTRSAYNIHANRVEMHHNISYNTKSYSLLLSAYQFGSENQLAQYCNIHHNTFVHGLSAPLVWSTHQTGPINQFNTVENNLFYDHVGLDGAAGGKMYEIYLDMYEADTTNLFTSTDPKGNIFRYNDVYSTTTTYMAILVRLDADTRWDTQADLVAAYPAWVNNFRSDPLIVDPAGYDFRLQAGSPALTGSSTGGVVGALGSGRTNRVHHILKIR